MATKNFSDRELKCSCCGRVNTTQRFNDFMAKVQELRDRYGRPLRVTSAYRCENHPIEAKKRKAGMHSIAAIDLGVSRGEAYKVLKLAFEMGFTGIGVNQKGKGRFIHLDTREKPTVWSY